MEKDTERTSRSAEGSKNQLSSDQTFAYVPVVFLGIILRRYMEVIMKQNIIKIPIVRQHDDLECRKGFERCSLQLEEPKHVWVVARLTFPLKKVMTVQNDL